MRNRIAAVLCALVLLAGVPLALSAQITSLTNNVTMGLFSTDVDNAFDVAYFSDVGAKSFGVADISSSNWLSAGYAATLSSLYLGLEYHGNVLAMTSNDGKYWDTTELVGADQSVIGTLQDYGDAPTSSTGSTNTFAVLAGVGKLGIQLGIYESVNTNTGYYSWNIPGGAANLTNYLTTGSWAIAGTSTSSGQSNSTTPDSTGTGVTTVTYTDATNGYSSYVPYLNLGTELAMGKMVLRPALGVNVSIINGYSSGDQAAKWSKYYQIVGSGLPTYSGVAETQYSQSYDWAFKDDALKLAGYAGADVQSGDWVFGLWYNLSDPMFSSAYTGSDGSSQTVKGSAYSVSYVEYSATPTGNTTTTTYGYQANPKTDVTHTINGNLKYTANPANRLSLALGFSPQVSIETKTGSETGSIVSTKVTTNTVTPTSGSTTVYTKSHTGNTTASTDINFNPTLTAAIQYAIIDKVLTINLGTSANLAHVATHSDSTSVPGYDSLQTVTTSYDGTVTASSYTSTLGNTRYEDSYTSFTLSNVSTSIRWGLAWNLAEGVLLDTKFSTSGSSFNVSSFTVMLSIKK